MMIILIHVSATAGALRDQITMNEWQRLFCFLLSFESLSIPVWDVVSPVIGVIVAQSKVSSSQAHALSINKCVIKEWWLLSLKDEAWPERKKGFLFPSGGSPEPRAWQLLTYSRTGAGPILFNLTGWIHVILSVENSDFNADSIPSIKVHYNSKKTPFCLSTLFSLPTQEGTTKIS